LQIARPKAGLLHFNPPTVVLGRFVFGTLAGRTAALGRQAPFLQNAPLLAVERDEAALVWRAMDERLPVEHRADCAPQSILQVRAGDGSDQRSAWIIT
jgi:hypothetical protein